MSEVLIGIIQVVVVAFFLLVAGLVAWNFYRVFSNRKKM